MQTPEKMTPVTVFPGVCAIFNPTGQPISNSPAEIK
jgi:hypothetical protein